VSTVDLLRYGVPWQHVAQSWVQAELQSPRFGEDYAVASASAATADPEVLLGMVRGWPDRGYFEGFPSSVEWHRVALAPEELRSVLYIDWDYWVDATAGSRLPSDAITRMGWDDWMLPGPPVEPIVLVTDSLAEPDRIVVLEGHARLTRFVAAGHRLVQPVDCWLGVSAEMHRWGCY
jgi:hypothetical protein